MTWRLLAGVTDPDPEPAHTYAVVLKDVDNDGYADLIEGNAGVNQVYINNQNVNDLFGGVQSNPLAQDKHLTTSVAVGDVNGDGNIDIVAGNSGADRLYLGNGTGNFPAGTDVTYESMWKKVEGATNTNPIVIEATGHGLTVGDDYRVRIVGVGGINVPDGDYEVTPQDDDFFELTGVNGKKITRIKVNVTGIQRLSMPLRAASIRR